MGTESAPLDNAFHQNGGAIISMIVLINQMNLNVINQIIHVPDRNSVAQMGNAFQKNINVLCLQTQGKGAPINQI